MNSSEATHRRDGDGVPRCVKKGFRVFVRCGFLAGGFARFRCPGCPTERLGPSLVSRAAERGISPIPTWTVASAASTARQRWIIASSFQIARIAGEP